MASTVPGIDRESIAAKLGIGVQTSDLSTLAAPTISLTPAAPGLRLGQLRRLTTGQADRTGNASPANGDGFAATLAKAIAARKAANENATRTSATRQPRVEARAEREHAVRDVVRQLKQLVDAAREAKGGSSSGSLKQSGQAIAHRDSAVDATTLRGVFERLADTEADKAVAKGEDLSLSPEQQAEVQALFQTVADVIARSMSPDGQIDEAALAAALVADPLVLAAAESLIAALQAQLVTAIPVVLPAAQSESDSVAGGEATGGQPAATSSTEQAVTARADASAMPVAPLTGSAPTAAAAALEASVVAPAGGQPRVSSASAEVALTPAGVVSEAVAVMAAAAGTTAEVREVAAQPTNTPAATEVVSVPATAVAGLTSVAGEVEMDDASVRAIATSSAGSVTPETVASAGVVDEASAAAVTAPAAVTGGDEVNASAPSSESEATNTLTLAASGQSGAQADTNGQDLEGEGGDAVSIEAAPVRAAGVSLSQASAGQAAADADGGATTVQTTQNASSVQSANSAGTTTGSTLSTAAGAAAPARGAEAVAQAQGATDGTPDVELHEQVSPVIVRQARLISGSGGHELTVRLNPDHLGPLHIRISLLEGVLSVGLTTANAEAQRAIENALPQLRGALVESGIRLDRLDVSQRNAGSGRDSGGNGQSGGQRDSANAGRGGGDQTGYAGNEGRQTSTGDSGASFADVLLDQDGRAFGSPARTSRWMGYRAYRRA